MKPGPVTSTHSWRDILELFEQWQSLPGGSREEWLARLQVERPGLHCRLSTIIEADQRAVAQGFLDEDVVSPLLQPAAVSERHGMLLGSWVLQEPIGRGGMGEVWLATRSDALYSGRAAVKLVNTAHAGAEAEARFAREGELLGRLAHPRITQLFDAGCTSDGTRYLIMEYVQGKPFDRACEDSRLSIDARLRLFLQVCEAVSYAHTQQIIHRDLKPANILVTADSHVKLLDFGVAKLLNDDAHGGGLTRAGCSWFTLEYGAPEQITNEPITTATDVYSLGVILFELLCGSSPHPRRADLYQAIASVAEPALTLREGLAASDVARIAAARSTTVAKLRQSLNKDLQVIVAKALKVSPNERYDTALALADDLRRYLEQLPVRARPDTWSYRAGKFIQRNRVQTIAAAAVVAVLLAGVIVASWQWRTAVAETQRTRAVIDVFKSIFNQLPPNQSATKLVSANEMLRRGWREASRRTEHDPQLRAAIAEPMGMLLLSMGDMAMGAEALGVMRAQMEASGDTRSGTYVGVTMNLGIANYRMGDAAAARDLFNQAVRVAATHNIDTPAAISARIFLADIARNEGKLEQARAQLASAAALAERRYGTDSKTYQMAITEQAGIESQLGNWEASEALRRRQIAPKSTDPEANAMRQLKTAIVEVDLGHYAQAAAMLQPLCAAADSLYAEPTGEKVFICSWLGVAEFYSGRQDSSDAAMAKAQSWARQGRDTVVRGLIDLIWARQLMRRNRIAQAETLVQEGLALFEAAGKTQRPNAEHARVLQGELLIRRNRIAEAQAALQRSYENQQQLYGGYQRQSHNLVLLQAIADDLSGAAAQSQARYEEAVNLAAKFLPDGHPDRCKLRLFRDYAGWRHTPSLQTQQRLRTTVLEYREALKNRADFTVVYTVTEELIEPAKPARLRTRLLALLDY